MKCFFYPSMVRVRWAFLGLLGATCVGATLGGAVSADSSAGTAQSTNVSQIAAALGLKESPRPLRETLADWRPPRKIMVNVGDDAARLDYLRQVVPAGVTLVGVKDRKEALQKIADVDGLVGSFGWCGEDLLSAGRRLRWVHVSSAGVNNCALDVMRERNIVLSNQQKVFGPEIAEHTIALILALTRGLDATMTTQRESTWKRSFAPSRLWSLEGRTLLVVGLGGIGTEVAQRAHGLGMRVIATRNSSREGPPFVNYVGLADELPKLLAQADVVVNAIPLTPQTKGLFDAGLFARMQKHAYYVNVGRGDTTVTDDLVAALKNGTIGGAALDVTDPEPLPDGHALWSAPNVLITPHMAPMGQGSSGSERSWLITREQLRRFATGDKLYSVVDLTRGY